MPDFKRAIERRLAGLALAPTRHAEIVLELSQHLQDRYDELRAGGATNADATRDSIAQLDLLSRQLADVERATPLEPVVLGRGGRSMIDALWQDVRYAARSVRKSPGFTTVVVLTLALGIGATTAIFSVVDGVMLRPLPYADIDRVVILSESTRTGRGMSVSWPNFQDWREKADVFDHLGVYRPSAVNLTGGDRPERLSASLASSDVFKALGVSALAGRAFLAEEDLAGADRVAIVSERLWRGYFNADPGLLGKKVNLNGEPHSVVGIMPASMRFPSRLTDVWLPLGLVVKGFPPRGAHPGLSVVGKLKPGVSVEQAVARMDVVARALEQQYPDSNTNTMVVVTPYYELIVRNIRPALLMLLGAVAFVLLIGCANLANLMLARADRRQREIAIRAALGADSRQILQQLLTESVMLALIGGALGSLLAWWSVKLFVASRPTTVPRIDLITVDLRVLAFALVVSIATGILFGLVPALRASSSDVVTSLKDAARGSTFAAMRRFRGGLVIAEVALALVLLIGGGLMTKSFSKLMAIDPGFSADRVVTMRLTLPNAKYPQFEPWLAFHQDLIRRIGAIPGIGAAAVNSAVPLEGGGSESMIFAEGQPMPTRGQPGTTCLFQTGSPDYFRVMGIQLLRGRSFNEHDTADRPPVAIVDETLVAKFFPSADPIGKRISFEQRGHSAEDAQPIWREVVGVVRHVRHYGLVTEPPFVQVYTPFSQLPMYMQPRPGPMALLARTALEPEVLTASIRREVAAIDRDIPVYGMQTMRGYLAQNTEQPRLNVMLLGAFSILALTLAVVGIYGVMSYSVSQRTQEIGVRMALGASHRHVMRLIVGHAMTLTAVGIAIGLGAAWGLTKWLGTLLFDVSPHDAATFVSISVLLSAVALLAGYLPGRRATRVDPMVTLRSE